VGIADCRISAEGEDSLVTYALGSCIGVGMVDEAARVGGLLHFMLPDSRAHANRSSRNPEAFADTGIPLLLRRITAVGAAQCRLRVRIAGGAQMFDGEALRIGRRNHLAARKVLWQLGLLVEMEAVGGTLSRNLGIHIGRGEFWVQTAAAENSGE
jgi:chemotaxis protein CheD